MEHVQTVISLQHKIHKIPQLTLSLLYYAIVSVNTTESDMSSAPFSCTYDGHISFIVTVVSYVVHKCKGR